MSETGCSCGGLDSSGCAYAAGSINWPQAGCIGFLPLPSSPVDGWLIDAADLLASPDPGPTAWLIEGLIVDRALVAAVGKWKTTKSYSLLDLCISIATGKPAFGRLATPVDGGKVMYICEESGRAALWRRLDALCRGRAIKPEELRGKLHVATNARVKLDDPRWQNELLDLGGAIKPCLVIFDPLARMTKAGLDENAKKEMGAVIEFWRLLRDEINSAVCLVHHVGHGGDHMRGTSDLESVWETKLVWERDGQAPVVKIRSEHREAESAGPHSYRINWDGLTRSMRFDLDDEKSAVVAIEAYVREHPDASANDIYKAVGGNRQEVLATVKRLREQAIYDAIDSLAEGGSSALEPPGTTPASAPAASGSEPTLFPFRESGLGNHLGVPGSNGSEPPLSEEEMERLAALARSATPGGTS